MAKVSGLRDRPGQLQLHESGSPVLGDLLDVGAVAGVREASADAVRPDLTGRDEERRGVALLGEEVGSAEEHLPERRCSLHGRELVPRQVVPREERLELRAPDAVLVEEPGGVAPHEERTRRVRVGPAVPDLLAPRGQPGVVEETAEVLISPGLPGQLFREVAVGCLDRPTSRLDIFERHDARCILMFHLGFPLRFCCATFR